LGKERREERGGEWKGTWEGKEKTGVEGKDKLPGSSI
jgi:hypothetical protein